MAFSLYTYLIRKLAKLLSSTDDKISGRIFTSLAIVDVYNVGIVQQCRMLEADVSFNVLALCLQNPTDAPSIVKSMRKEIIQSDFDVLLRSAATHPLAKYIASVAEITSWCRLWDLWYSGNTWTPDTVESAQPQNLRRLFMSILWGLSLCGSTTYV